jgi:hypothetical protein
MRCEAVAVDGDSRLGCVLGAGERVLPARRQIVPCHCPAVGLEAGEGFGQLPHCVAMRALASGEQDEVTGREQRTWFTHSGAD